VSLTVRNTNERFVFNLSAKARQVAGLWRFVAVYFSGAADPVLSRLSAVFAIALVNYGAVILSFVGALHWGFAMTVQDMSAKQRSDRFIWSVIPALIAWIATLLPMPLGCLLLVIGFVVHLRQDRQLLQVMRLPAWYLPMRLRLTLVASFCLLLAAIVETLHS